MKIFLLFAGLLVINVHSNAQMFDAPQNNPFGLSELSASYSTPAFADLDGDGDDVFPIPTGYRLPTKNDIKKGNDWYRCVTEWNLPEPYHAVGDFNGDGLLDHAYILLKGNTDRWGLFCFFKTAQGYSVKQLPVGTEVKTEGYIQYNIASNYAIKPWNKGEFVCLYDDEGQAIISRKKLTYDAIGFELLESEASAFVFNKTKNSFTNYFSCN